MYKIIIISIIFLLLSCKNNNKPGLRLKDIEEIITEEKKQQEKKTKVKNSFRPDSIIKHHHYKEDRKRNYRGVVKVNLEANVDEREFRLSDIGKQIEYIKLKHPDSLYFLTGSTNVLFAENYIITHNLRGSCIYENNGDFINYIVKNEIEIFQSTRGNIGYGMGSFKGVMAAPSVYKNNLLFVVTDVPKKYKILYSFNLNEENIYKDSSTLINNAVVLQKYKGNLSQGISSFSYLANNVLLGFNSFWNSVQENELFYSFNNSGDTLCTFRNYDIVNEFNYRNYQVTESKSLYRLTDGLRYRQAYNDTVYIVENEQTLKPIYILDRGDKGITTLKGMTPGSDLKGKIIILDVFENPNWLIIETSNNHPSRNNLKKGIVQFTEWFYSKDLRKVWIRSVESKNKIHKLTNNLDNGFDFWPSGIDHYGNLIEVSPVKYLIEDYGENALKQNLPFEQFSDNELLITIIK